MTVGLLLQDSVDCLIVGGGPAGLVAATYLARFKRHVVVVDAGDSRARQIPLARNCPGFPDGISGLELLDRLSNQAMNYSVPVLHERIEAIFHLGEKSFVACTESGDAIHTRSILLATGLVDLAPALPHIEEAINRGFLRLCPVCDGFEVADKKVGVIGADDHALEEANFLKTFTQDVTLLGSDPVDFDRDLRARADAMGVGIMSDVLDVVQTGSGYRAVGRESAVVFDALYPALGCSVRSELAVGLGIKLDDAKHIVVDGHQRTNVEGVFAAGDVVDSLNQLAVSYGQAATAAVSIHRFLMAAHSTTGGRALTSEKSGLLH